MATDWFVAELQCPHCGSTSRADDSTGMLTRIQGVPTTSYIRVGDRVDSSPQGIALQYVSLRPLLPGETNRILLPWSCPTCANDNWARAEIAQGVLTSIRNVPLTSAEVADAHFISPEIQQAFRSLTRRDLWGRDFELGYPPSEDVREPLLKALSADGSKADS
jgi:hypothetical protein